MLGEAILQASKDSRQKSKNGHNALIWHLLHAGYFIYANTRGTFYQNAPTKGENLTPGWSVGVFSGHGFLQKYVACKRHEYQSTFHLRPQRSLRLITLFGCRQL